MKVGYQRILLALECQCKLKEKKVISIQQEGKNLGEQHASLLTHCDFLYSSLSEIPASGTKLMQYWALANSVIPLINRTEMAQSMVSKKLVDSQSALLLQKKRLNHCTVKADAEKIKYNNKVEKIEMNEWRKPSF